MNDFDFVPLSGGGVRIKINGDDGYELKGTYPWRIDTTGNTVELSNAETTAIQHRINLDVDTAKINGGANITNAADLREALQGVLSGGQYLMP